MLREFELRLACTSLPDYLAPWPPDPPIPKPTDPKASARSKSRSSSESILSRTESTRASTFTFLPGMLGPTPEPDEASSLSPSASSSDLSDLLSCEPPAAPSLPLPFLRTLALFAYLAFLRSCWKSGTLYFDLSKVPFFSKFRSSSSNALSWCSRKSSLSSLSLVTKGLQFAKISAWILMGRTLWR